MSTSKHVTIWCDELGTDGRTYRRGSPDGCPEWYDSGQAKVADTRRDARQIGWRYRGGFDYCPNHTRLETS